MAQPITDQALLKDFVEDGSETAFQTLVQRHVDLVFGTARRGSADMAVAQEITQSVFIALARKGAWLRGEGSLAGWLHKTTLLETRQWWRGELRRQRREQTAVELGTTMKDEPSLLKSMAGVLDDGLLELRETDRQVIMLRFFEDQTYREIAVALGAKEDAIRKRIDKALDKLTRFFRLRGYAVPAAATTVAALRGAAQAAPAGLAAAASKAAVAGGVGAGSGLGLLFAHFMGLTRMQTALVCFSLAIVPIAWQTNALISTYAARNQMSNQLEAVLADLAANQQEQNEVQRQLTLAANALNASDSALQPPGVAAKSTAAADSSLYRWSEASAYVRLPKSLFPQIHLTGDPRDLPRGEKSRVGAWLSTNGQWEIPSVSLQALGLDEVQMAAVNASVDRFNVEFSELQKSHTVLTNRLPDGEKSGEYPALIIRPFAPEGRQLKVQLRTA